MKTLHFFDASPFSPETIATTVAASKAHEVIVMHRLDVLLAYLAHAPIVVAVVVAFPVVAAGHDEDAAREADDEAATSEALRSVSFITAS
jgi:hypothetical protein